VSQDDRATPGKPPQALTALRDQIDAIDGRVLELLAERMQVVAQIAAVKQKERVQIRDFGRERAVLDDRKRRAEALGISVEPVESIYRQIMLASRDYQASLGAAASIEVEKKKIAIIGGLGQMGQMLGRMFRELGHEVVLADVGTTPTPEEAAASVDVVIISVPIASTIAVIEAIGPRVKADGLILDVTSLKQAPLEAMLRASRASVVGTHPMFGPGVHSLQGQRVVVCKGRGEPWHDWLIRNFEARGLIVTAATAEEHDRGMALVQVLTHFQTQVLGWALARIGVPLEQSLRFTSPAYLMELYVAARHFGQDPLLYGPIEMQNPETQRVTAAFRRAADELSEVLAQRDQARFNKIFEEVRAFFGDFTAEATEQSSFLIDRLVERTLG
jgi:chorismate mutase/prephenate dehydrogenase